MGVKDAFTCGGRPLLSSRGSRSRGRSCSQYVPRAQRWGWPPEPCVGLQLHDTHGSLERSAVASLSRLPAQHPLIYHVADTRAVARAGSQLGSQTSTCSGSVSGPVGGLTFVALKPEPVRSGSSCRRKAVLGRPCGEEFHKWGDLAEGVRPRTAPQQPQSHGKLPCAASPPP